MIVEQRTYILHPGKVKEWLKIYEEHGLEPQRRNLGTMVGYFYAEFGQLNQIVHMWAYKDLADRADRRARLAADPAWQNFGKLIRGFMMTQENKILIPAPFSPYADAPAKAPATSTN